MREYGQRLGEIHALHDHVRRDGKLHGGEVPDAFHARLHKRRRALLGGIVRHREDPEMYLHPSDESDDLRHGPHLHAMDGLPVELGVRVERHHDGEVLLGKSAVADKRMPQRAAADERDILEATFPQKG